MNDRGYAVMMLRKTGERTFENVRSRDLAEGMAQAIADHYPTLRVSVVEWRVVSVPRKIHARNAKAR